MNNTPRNSEQGPKSARYMGAEWAANPGESRKEYLDSAAYYFGEDKETFYELSPDEKSACLTAFNEGVAAERALQYS